LGGIACGGLRHRICPMPGSADTSWKRRRGCSSAAIFSPREAAERFLAAVGDRDLYSDEVDFDRHWLTMLADGAGVSLGQRGLGDVKRLSERSTVAANEPPHHRAEADARRLALALSRSRP